jgi:hypothetical protein
VYKYRRITKTFFHNPTQNIAENLDMYHAEPLILITNILSGDILVFQRAPFDFHKKSCLNICSVHQIKASEHRFCIASVNKTGQFQLLNRYIGEGHSILVKKFVKITTFQVKIIRTVNGQACIKLPNCSKTGGYMAVNIRK